MRYGIVSVCNMEFKRREIMWKEFCVNLIRKELHALRRAHRLRRRSYMNPAPNFAWHVDWYDKLKPYAFPIHGCVDGCSRRVMWLKVCRTNNDPSHVASFFYECVKITNGCPRIYYELIAAPRTELWLQCNATFVPQEIRRASKFECTCIWIVIFQSTY